MVEVVISTLLVGMLTIVSLDAVGSAITATRVASEQLDANTLAASLMAEILSLPYEDTDDTAPVVFGIESDEVGSPTSRAGFDDIDDYRNWSSQPETRGGNPISGTDGWLRKADVVKLNWQSPSTQLGDGQSDQGIRQVTVTVCDDDGKLTTLAAICSRDGHHKQALGVDATVVTGVVITCTASGQTHEVCASVGNHAMGP